MSPGIPARRAVAERGKLGFIERSSTARRPCLRPAKAIATTGIFLMRLAGRRMFGAIGPMTLISAINGLSAPGMALGVSTAFMAAVVKRRMTWKMFENSVRSTLAVSCMFVIVAAKGSARCSTGWAR